MYEHYRAEEDVWETGLEAHKTVREKRANGIQPTAEEQELTAIGSEELMLKELKKARSKRQEAFKNKSAHWKIRGEIEKDLQTMTVRSNSNLMIRCSNSSSRSRTITSTAT